MNHPSRWLALLLALAVGNLFAASEPPEAEAPVTTDEAPEPTWYDTAHDEVSERLVQTAVWFDSFFGDPRAAITTEANADLQVILDGFYSGVPDESDYKVRVRGGVNLPRFENKLRLVITSDAESAITGQDLSGVEPDRLEPRNESGGIGLRYLLKDESRHHFSVGGGLSGGTSPAVNLAGRYVYTLPLSDRSVTHVAPTLYWNSDKGAGVSALADYEFTPEPDTLWRYSLYGKYGEQTDGLEWSTQAKWFRRLNRKTAISAATGVRGETETDNVIREGWLGFTYRRNIWRPWFFVEAEPGLSWHEKVDYRTEPTFGLRMEFQFYKQ